MTIILIIVGALLFFYLFGVIIGLPMSWLIQDYPKEWEEKENQELEEKFKEYDKRKSQD